MPSKVRGNQKRSSRKKKTPKDEDKLKPKRPRVTHTTKRGNVTVKVVQQVNLGSRPRRRRRAPRKPTLLEQQQLKTMALQQARARMTAQQQRNIIMAKNNSLVQDLQNQAMELRNSGVDVNTVAKWMSQIRDTGKVPQQLTSVLRKAGTQRGAVGRNPRIPQTTRRRQAPPSTPQQVIGREAYLQHIIIDAKRRLRQVREGSQDFVVIRKMLNDAEEEMRKLERQARRVGPGSLSQEDINKIREDAKQEAQANAKTSFEAELSRVKAQHMRERQEAEKEAELRGQVVGRELFQQELVHKRKTARERTEQRIELETKFLQAPRAERNKLLVKADEALGYGWTRKTYEGYLKKISKKKSVVRLPKKYQALLASFDQYEEPSSSQFGGGSGTIGSDIDL